MPAEVVLSNVPKLTELCLPQSQESIPGYQLRSPCSYPPYHSKVERNGTGEWSQEAARRGWVWEPDGPGTEQSEPSSETGYYLISLSLRLNSKILKRPKIGSLQDSYQKQCMSVRCTMSGTKKTHV